jgi:hypothetical protein
VIYTKKGVRHSDYTAIYLPLQSNFQTYFKMFLKKKEKYFLKKNKKITIRRLITPIRIFPIQNSASIHRFYRHKVSIF